MGSNPILYPPEYSADLTGDSSAEFAFDDAVQLLQVQDRDTAVRNTKSRFIALQGIIKNRQAQSYQYRMPKNEIGQNQAPQQPLLGTIAYLGGGREYSSPTVNAIARFNFSGETTAQTGMYLSEGRSYMAAVGNASNGFFMGGSAVGGLSNTIDNVNYQSVTCKRLAIGLSVARYGPAGIGNNLAGVVFGGWSVTGLRATADRLTYGQEPTISSLGNKLLTARWAPHQGTSNRFTGFIYGGAGSQEFYNYQTLLTSIEAFTFASNTMSTATGSLTYAHASHAAFGSTTKGYVAGGISATNGNFTAAIEALTYSGQTTTVLGVSLSEQRVCCDGIGSSLAGYVVGGDTPSGIAANGGWFGSTKIERLTYSSETVAVIGATLPTASADQGGLSDYGAGFVF